MPGAEVRRPRRYALHHALHILVNLPITVPMLPTISTNLSSITIAKYLSIIVKLSTDAPKLHVVSY
jgi:hypothetical protein